LSVYFDGEDESPKSDAMKTKKPGGDLLVCLEGVDETPESAIMNSKKTIAITTPDNWLARGKSQSWDWLQQRDSQAWSITGIDSRSSILNHCVQRYEKESKDTRRGSNGKRRQGKDKPTMTS
jgi:hypothetical protein